MSKEAEFLIKIVKEASNIITDSFEVKEKDNNGDLVTNLDYEVEQFLISKIKEEYLNFSIISEEYNSQKELTENCFTIDPIDGTINFAHNLPFWAIQVACIKEGKTCASVIYAPKLNELYYADESGAYLNGKPIHVNNLDINKGVYTIEGPDSIIGEYKMKKINHYYRSICCAALDFAFVASGRYSALNFYYDNLWDYIPGEYLVEKAGGIIHNEPKLHIAANNKEFLKVLLDNSKINNNEQLTIIEK